MKGKHENNLPFLASLHLDDEQWQEHKMQQVCPLINEWKVKKLSLSTFSLI